ncbi:MAG: hypothetical protein J6328_06400, partial [Bacilli bacterium]|nr:hypothetical protein [Bacilli bacterium]
MTLRKTFLAALCVASSLATMHCTAEKKAPQLETTEETHKVVKEGKLNARIPTLEYKENESDSLLNDYPSCAGNYQPKIISPDYDGKSAPTDFTSHVSGKITYFDPYQGHDANGEPILKDRDRDVDLYEFHTYGRADISARLYNIPTGTNLDFELLSHVEYDEGESPTESVHGENKLKTIDVSNNRMNQQENVNYYSALPNTYYLKVYSPERDGVNYYDVELTVHYTPAQDESIDELRYQKGAVGAVWVSDYDPFGIHAFKEHGKRLVGITDGKKNSYTNPMFSYLEKFERIHHATIYLWDPTFRNHFAQILDGLYKSMVANKEALKKQLEEAKKQYKDVQFWLEVNDFVFGGLLEVGLALIPGGNAAGKVVSKIGKALCGYTATFSLSQAEHALAKCILEKIFPAGTEENISDLNTQYQNVEDLISYYGAAKKIFESGMINNDNGDVYEVKKLVSYYSLTKEGSYKHCIDFMPLNDEIYNLSGVHASTYIPAYSADAHFNGTIYPLRNDKDWEYVDEKEEPLFPDANTATPIDVSSQAEAFGTLVNCKYLWYKFTAPDYGTYSFTCHSIDVDTAAELFYEPKDGKSRDGLLAESDDYNPSVSKDCRIEYPLTPTRSVYLRVHSPNWKGNGIFNLTIERIGDADNITIFGGTELPNITKFDNYRKYGYPRGYDTYGLQIET